MSEGEIHLVDQCPPEGTPRGTEVSTTLCFKVLRSYSYRRVVAPLDDPRWCLLCQTADLRRPINGNLRQPVLVFGGDG